MSKLLLKQKNQYKHHRIRILRARKPKKTQKKNFFVASDITEEPRFIIQERGDPEWKVDI